MFDDTNLNSDLFLSLEDLLEEVSNDLIGTSPMGAQTPTPPLHINRSKPSSMMLQSFVESGSQADESATTNGTQSLVMRSVSCHLPAPGSVTPQLLNQALLTLTGSLSRQERKEHRAISRALDSLAYQSIQKGCKNTKIIYRTDLHVAGLIAAGLLPSGSLLGRMKLFGMPYLERVAIKVPLAFLIDLEEDIKEWVEDNTQDGADNVFNALVIGSVIAASNGYWQMSSTIASRLMARLGVMPDTASKSRLLRNPDALLALAAAY